MPITAASASSARSFTYVHEHLMAGFDPNMTIALCLGEALEYRPLVLPASLADIGRRTDFILAIDKPLLVDADGLHQWSQFGTHLQQAAEHSRKAMPELDQDSDRVSIALRLWAGCLVAVKAIAHQTRSGPNNAEIRSVQFQTIEAIAQRDALFAAGVQAAPSFLVARAQSYSLDGVTLDSQVRRYADDDSATAVD